MTNDIEHWGHEKPPGNRQGLPSSLRVPLPSQAAALGVGHRPHPGAGDCPDVAVLRPPPPRRPWLPVLPPPLHRPGAFPIIFTISHSRRRAIVFCLLYYPILMRYNPPIFTRISESNLFCLKLSLNQQSSCCALFLSFLCLCICMPASDNAAHDGSAVARSALYCSQCSFALPFGGLEMKESACFP